MAENIKFSVHMTVLGSKCAEQIVLLFLLLNANCTCKHFINLGGIVCDTATTESRSGGRKYLPIT